MALAPVPRRRQHAPPMHTEPNPRAESLEFVLDLGRTLHDYGASAPEVEHAMLEAARKLGLLGEFFATPTSIFACFHDRAGAHAGSTHLMRVQPSAADLGRRARVDQVLFDVLDGGLTPREGKVLLAAIRLDPASWPRSVTTSCWALTAAAAARFFGLSVAEIGLAGLAGLAVGLLDLAAARSARLGRVFLPLAALLAGALVALVNGLRGEPTALQVVVAGLIVLMPGLRLTTAMSELALDHLAAGTARFFGAVMTLLALLFGAALGVQVGELLPDRVPLAAIAAARAEVPAWTLWLALAVAPLCFGVLFQALPRDLPWILASCVLAFTSARLGAGVLGAGFESALGALAVGVASNVYARLCDRPAVTTMLPGILLLVPGSLSFQSLLDLLERDVISGIDTAFRVATVGCMGRDSWRGARNRNAACLGIGVGAS